VFEEREQDPLDVNQQLMAPAWWDGTVNANWPAGLDVTASGGPNYGNISPAPSGGVKAFEVFFHRLIEPLPNPGVASNNPTALRPWDRGGYPSRRAFYSKFLILSSGPDEQLGVFLYSDADPPTLPSQLLANENNALPFSIWDGVADFTANAVIQQTTISSVPSSDPTRPSSYDLQQAAQDDISNHNLQSTVGIGGS